MSPAIYQYSLQGLMGLLFGLVLAFFLPLTVNSKMIPGTPVVAILLGWLMENWQKRI